MWTSIDDVSDLKAFRDLICWDDSEILEIYATASLLPHLPDDVCRSGRNALNYFILIRACCGLSPFLEIAFIQCEDFNAHALIDDSGSWHIETLMSIENNSTNGSRRIRTARGAYRWIDRPNTPFNHFGSSDFKWTFPGQIDWSYGST
jgi:hypothetical protein